MIYILEVSIVLHLLFSGLISELQTADLDSTSKFSRQKRSGSPFNKDEVIKFIDRSRQSSQEVKSYVGTNVRFDCRAHGEPKPNIRWEKDGRPFSLVSYRLMYKQHDYKEPWVLVLDKLLVADSGKYKCIVWNILLKRSQMFTLIVEERPAVLPPVIRSVSPQNVSLQIGEDASISCLSEPVKGVIPFLKWEKHVFFNRSLEGDEMSDNVSYILNPSLKESEGIQHAEVLHRTKNFTLNFPGGLVEEITTLKLDHGDSSILELHDVTLKDSGVYICVAFNNMGYTKQNVTVTVHPVPEPSRNELERRYIAKYSRSDFILPLPLSVMIVFPISVLVIAVIGCVYWHEKERRKRRRYHHYPMLMKKVSECVSVQLDGTTNVPPRKRPLIGLPPRIIDTMTTSDEEAPPRRKPSRRVTLPHVPLITVESATSDDEKPQRRVSRKASHNPTQRSSVASRRSNHLLDATSRKRSRTTTEEREKERKSSSSVKRSNTTCGQSDMRSSATHALSDVKESIAQDNDSLIVGNPSLNTLSASEIAAKDGSKPTIETSPSNNQVPSDDKIAPVDAAACANIGNTDAGKEKNDESERLEDSDVQRDATTLNF